MRTIQQCEVRIEELTKRGIDIKGDISKGGPASVISGLKRTIKGIVKSIDYERQLLSYLESGPTEESLERQLEKLKGKISAVENMKKKNGWGPLRCKEVDKEQGVAKIKATIYNLKYILNQ